MSDIKNTVRTPEELRELFSTPPPTVELVVEDEKYGTIKFEIRPMDNETYAKMGQAVRPQTSMPQTRDDALGAITTFGNAFYPMMKVVFPYCCVNPKIVDGNMKGAWNINNVPMHICTEVFMKILEISGLTPEGVDSTKN